MQKQTQSYKEITAGTLIYSGNCCIYSLTEHVLKMFGILNQKSLSILFLHQESQQEQNPTDLHQDVIYGCLHLQDEAVAGIILVQCELVVHTEGRY